IKADRVQHWLGSGAELSESAEALVLKAAPEVVKAHHAQLAARRRKEGEKRRARRRAKAAA
ncbi:MAG: 30S ribosomal protein S16, partial [Chlamydiia bacterium]|nr:30S ribosomal protein S16 [Chlamydiia bacterium]